MSLRIEREKQLRQIFKVGAAIVIQSHIRRYLVQKGFIVSHPLEIYNAVKTQFHVYNDEIDDNGETLKKKLMSRLKVLLITGR